MKYTIAKYRGEKGTYPPTEFGYLKKVNWDEWFLVIDTGDELEYEEFNCMIRISPRTDVRVMSIDFDFAVTSGKDFKKFVSDLTDYDKKDLLKHLVDSLKNENGIEN